MQKTHHCRHTATTKTEALLHKATQTTSSVWGRRGASKKRQKARAEKKKKSKQTHSGRRTREWKLRHIYTKRHTLFYREMFWEWVNINFCLFGANNKVKLNGPNNNCCYLYLSAVAAAASSSSSSSFVCNFSVNGWLCYAFCVSFFVILIRKQGYSVAWKSLFFQLNLNAFAVAWRLLFVELFVSEFFFISFCSLA